jgi:hypothetical protein
MDALAQAVGMLNYSDYLSPHLWTVVGIMLACRGVVRHATVPQLTERASAPVPHLRPAPAG